MVARPLLAGERLEQEPGNRDRAEATVRIVSVEPELKKRCKKQAVASTREAPETCVRVLVRRVPRRLPQNNWKRIDHGGTRIPIARSVDRDFWKRILLA